MRKSNRIGLEKQGTVKTLASKLCRLNESGIFRKSSCILFSKLNRKKRLRFAKAYKGVMVHLYIHDTYNNEKYLNKKKIN